MAKMLVVGAAMIERGRCLVAQRGANTSHPLKWEFPGGKVEPGESEAAALCRELLEELDVRISVGDLLCESENSQIVLRVYRATIVAGTPKLLEHQAFGWFTAEALMRLDLGPLDRAPAEAARRALKSSR